MSSRKQEAKRRSSFTVAFCTIAAGLALSSAVIAAEPASAQWPGWLGPNRDGHSPDTGLLKQWPAGGPKLLWKVDNIGGGWSSMAVVNGCVYTTGNEGNNLMLICIGLDGKEKWRVVQGPRCQNGGGYPGARSTPVIDGDRLYLTGGDGLVTCHNLADGKIVWSRDMEREMGGKVGGWRYAESVLILGKLAIVTPGGRNAIVALDKATGQDVWKADVSATAEYSSCIPITDKDSTIIVNGSQSGLIAVDAATGKKVWSDGFAAHNTANCPTPAYADGFLFWGVGYGKGSACYKVDHTGGNWTFTQAWTSKDIDCHPGNYVIADGHIFGRGRGGLVCADLKSGKALWSQRVNAGQACWADGMVYVFSNDGGQASLVDPSVDGGKTAGKFQVAGKGNSWSHPVVIGGKLFLRYDTNLYCYDVRAAAN